MVWFGMVWFGLVWFGMVWFITLKMTNSWLKESVFSINNSKNMFLIPSGIKRKDLNLVSFFDLISPENMVLFGLVYFVWIWYGLGQFGLVYFVWILYGLGQFGLVWFGMAKGLKNDQK